MNYYEDDILHPNNTQNENNEDDDQTTYAVKYKKNSHCKYIYRRDTDTGNLLKIDFYENGFVPNSCIRTAVHGVRYKLRTGSNDEKLFYKVNIATGFKGEKTPYILFFHSPEEYEQHFHAVVSDEQKMEWNRRNQEEIHRRQKVKEARVSVL